MAEEKGNNDIENIEKQFEDNERTKIEARKKK